MAAYKWYFRLSAAGQKSVKKAVMVMVRLGIDIDTALDICYTASSEYKSQYGDTGPRAISR